MGRPSDLCGQRETQPAHARCQPQSHFARRPPSVGRSTRGQTRHQLCLKLCRTRPCRVSSPALFASTSAVGVVREPRGRQAPVDPDDKRRYRDPTRAGGCSSSPDREGHIGRGRRRRDGGRRGGGGSNDGPGHQAAKHAGSHGAAPASGIGSRGCKRCHRNGNGRCTASDKASLHR